MLQGIRYEGKTLLFSLEGIRKMMEQPEGLQPIYDVLSKTDAVVLQDINVVINIRTGNELKEWIEKNVV